MLRPPSSGFVPLPGTNYVSTFTVGRIEDCGACNVNGFADGRVERTFLLVGWGWSL